MTKKDSIPGTTGSFNIWKSIPVLHHIKKKKKPKDKEKEFDKIQHPFMIKSTWQIRNRKELPHW